MSANRPKGKGDRQVAVKFKIELPSFDELPLAVYANYVRAGHTGFEVTLDFAQLTMPATEDELKALGPTPTLVAKPVARIAVPHVLLDDLIRVLSERRDIIKSTGEEVGG